MVRGLRRPLVRLYSKYGLITEKIGGMAKSCRASQPLNYTSRATVTVKKPTGVFKGKGNFRRKLPQPLFNKLLTGGYQVPNKVQIRRFESAQFFKYLYKIFEIKNYY